MADVTSWLPNLLGPIDLYVNGIAAGVPRRSKINITGGATVTDNPTNGTTDINVSAGTTPTGTGFPHVTGGALDSAARAVNLASADVTGVLPTANQASQAVGGDLTGTTASATVAKVNGTTYPAGGSLTPGNVAQVSGAGAVTYGAISLSNTNSVTGTLPYANMNTATQGFHMARGVSTSNVASLSGLPGSIDGVTYANNDRILLVGQSTASQNGIWVVNSGGGWTRPTDWNTGGPPLAENWIGVSEGTAGAHTVYRVTTQGTIAVGITSVAIAIYTTTAPDATTSSKGIVELANDLAGTATAPTVKQVTGDGTGLLTLLATIESWASGNANSYCVSYIFHAATTATTANQTIATIPTVASSGTNKLDIVISAAQTAGNVFWSRAIDTSYFENGGSVPVIMGTDTLSTEKSAGTVGTVNPNTAASSHNVIVRVTPWSTSSTTWTTIVQKTVAT